MDTHLKWNLTDNQLYWSDTKVEIAKPHYNQFRDNPKVRKPVDAHHEAMTIYDQQTAYVKELEDALRVPKATTTELKNTILVKGMAAYVRAQTLIE